MTKKLTVVANSKKESNLLFAVSDKIKIQFCQNDFNNNVLAGLKF